MNLSFLFGMYIGAISGFVLGVGTVIVRKYVNRPATNAVPPPPARRKPRLLDNDGPGLPINGHEPKRFREWGAQDS